MKKVLFLSFFLFFSFIAFSQIPSASNTGDLNVERWVHESQLLDNGKVLVFGGDNGNFQNLQVYSSAELYNPSTEAWTYTGSMSVPRTDFTSALLPDGSVLAIGGNNTNLTNQSSCETYKISSGSWVAAAPMQMARAKHAAIVLKNGKVLVVGGTTDNSCEIYDPAANAWSNTSGNLIARGNGVSLALLKDGRVLATGGDATLARTSAEIYDPKLGTWTKITAAMNGERYDHSSLVLNDGNVMIAGTASTNYTTQITPQIFNVTTNTFSNTSPMKCNVGESNMVLTDDGSVILYGLGDFFSAGNTKVIQMFDMASSSWITGTYSNIGTNEYTIHRLMNGKILIIGGSSTTGNGASKLCLLLTQQGFSSCAVASLNLNVNGLSICEGKDAFLSLNASEAGVTYQPLLANGIAAGSAVSGGGNITLSASASSLTKGLNLIKVKVEKAGCPAYYLSDTAVITVVPSVIPVPVISVSGPLTFCSGGNVQLTAPAGYDAYLWSNDNATQSITVNQAASFSVKVFNTSGCASPSSSPILTGIYPSSVSAGTNEITCISNAPYALTGYAPSGGSWSGTGVSANGTFNPSASGAGTFTLTYSLCTKTSTKTITVVPLPVINDFTVTSLKDTVCSSTGTSIQVLSSMIGVSYRLKVGNTNVGNAVAGNGASIILPTGNLTATTDFSIVASVSNFCGPLELIKNKKITVAAIPSAKTIIYSDTICQNQNTVWVKIVNSDPSINYRLYTTSSADQSFTKGNGDTLFLSMPYQGYIDVQAQNIFGCDIVTIGHKQIGIFNHVPAFTVQQSYLPGETVNIVNNSNGDSYLWTFDGSAPFTSSQQINPPSFQYSSTGAKSIKLVSRSHLGCVDSIIKNVYVFNAAPSSAGNTCFLDTITSVEKYAGYKKEYEVLAFHVDTHNNSYVAGIARNDVGGNNSGSYSFYLHKFDPAGNLLWKKVQYPEMYSGSSAYVGTFISSIATDAQDNVYIAGSFTTQNGFKFDHLSTPDRNLSASNAYIVKMNSAGVAQWMIYGDQISPSDVAATDILYTDNDHIYVSMYEAGKMIFADGTSHVFQTELTVMQIDKDGKYKRDFLLAEIPAADLQA